MSALHAVALLIIFAVFLILAAGALAKMDNDPEDE